MLLRMLRQELCTSSHMTQVNAAGLYQSQSEGEIKTARYVVQQLCLPLEQLVADELRMSAGHSAACMCQHGDSM